MLLDDDKTAQEETPKPRSRKRAIVLAGFFLLVVLGTAWYLRSDLFQEQVRARVVRELERMTGGEVELRSFTWNLSRLEFVAEDLTIHGLEPRDVAPYAHIDYLKVRVKIMSVMQREIGLSFVSASRPKLHIIVNKDGTTNQPTPKARSEEGRSPLDVLFELVIDRMEVAEGELLWNDRKIPLDFKAEKVSALVTYDYESKRYEGRFSVAGSLLEYADYRPLSSNAELQLSLGRNEAEIKSFKWASPASQLEASGRIQKLDDPTLDLAYDGTFSATELASVARVMGLKAGTLDLKGTLTASAGKYATAGRAQLKGLTWRDNGVSLDRVNGAAQYSLEPKTLDLKGMTIQALGGIARGTAHIANWSDLNAQGDATQKGEVTLTLSGVQVGSAVSAVASQKLPVDKLHLSGAASGTITARWKGKPKNAEVVFALAVAPPEDPAPHGLPLRAEVRGRYHGGANVFELAEFHAATPASRIAGSGTLGTEAGRLTIKAESTDLAEFDPLLSKDGSRFPVVLDGRATFDGTITGEFAQPSIRGRLEIAGFESIIAMPAAEGAPPAEAKRIHWDALGTNVDYTPQQIRLENGRLQRGSAQITFSGTSTLSKGAFAKDAAVFSARMSLRNAQLQDVQDLAGTTYPVTGTLDARGEVSGTLETMRGAGHAEVTGGEIYGEPFKTIRADARIAGKDVQIQNLTLAQNGASLEANGSYNLAAKTFRFEAKGENIDLGHIDRLKTARVKLGGTAAFTATGSGTMEQPTVNANLRVRGLMVNGEVAGDLTAEAITKGRELQIKARSNFQNADLTADGTVDLRGDLPSRIAVKFNDFSFDPLLRPYMQGKMDATTSMAGTINLSGPLKTPKLLRVEANVDQLSAEVEKIRLTNAMPIIFIMEDQVLNVRQFHVTGDGTDLTAAGSIQVAGEQRLNLTANGRANLRLFQGLSPGLLSYGNTTMDMKVGGTVAKPAMTGEVTIKDAGVSFIDLPNGLSGINGTLAFNQDRLQIQTLTAKTGGGQLDIGGFIAYRSGLFFNLTATGQDIRLRYPPGISTSVNADLRYIGTPATSVLSGDVLVTRFGVNPRFDFALYLARSKQPIAAPTTNPFLENLRLDVHVTSTPELQVETSLAKLSGNADLRIRGTAAQPAVLGRVNVVEGEINFSGTKYNLERGDITFTNPVRIEPVLNMEASARVREYDITLGFHGTAGKNLNVNYRSEPPLPSADIIALLALGRTREEAVITQQQVNQSFTETASNAILGQALNAAVSSRVEKLFGVSRIKIDPQVGGPENANARVTIEQQVSNNVTLTYITNLAQSAQQVIQVEVNVTKDVSIVAVRDQNGVLGFDVRIRQRKK